MSSSTVPASERRVTPRSVYRFLLTAINDWARGPEPISLKAARVTLYPDRPLESKATVQKPSEDWFRVGSHILHGYPAVTPQEDEAWKEKGA